MKGQRGGEGSGLPGGDHEVTHPGRFQGDCDDDFLRCHGGFGGEETGGRKKNYPFSEKQPLLISLKKNVERCAPPPTPALTPESKPLRPDNRRSLFTRLRFQAASGGLRAPT